MHEIYDVKYTRDNEKKKIYIDLFEIMYAIHLCNTFVYIFTLKKKKLFNKM